MNKELELPAQRAPLSGPVPEAKAAVVSDAGVPETIITVPSLASRWHHLDALRGLLMILGVVLHAAYVYSTEGGWLVHDQGRSSFFEWLSNGIHLFRLPCFFMISGFLSVMVLQQKGQRHFLRSRTQRLAIPFLAAALLLNSSQSLLLAWHRERPFRDCYAGGGWLSHLWFLLDLLICIYALVLVWPLLSRVPAQRLPILGGAIVLILPLVSVLLPAIASRALGIHGAIAGFLDFHELVYYGSFFAFGVAYQPGKDDRRDRLFTCWALLLPVIALAAKSLSNRHAVETYFEASLSWTCALVCLWLGKIVFARPSPCIRALADNSYTIYLFHHLSVIAFAIALIYVPMSIWLKYPIVVICTLAMTLAVHRYLISRFRWLRLLFNGT